MTDTTHDGQLGAALCRIRTDAEKHALLDINVRISRLGNQVKICVVSKLSAQLLYMYTVRTHMNAPAQARAAPKSTVLVNVNS